MLNIELMEERMSQKLNEKELAGRNYLKEELIQISKVSNSRLLKMK